MSGKKCHAFLYSYVHRLQTGAQCCAHACMIIISFVSHHVSFFVCSQAAMGLTGEKALFCKNVKGNPQTGARCCAHALPLLSRIMALFCVLTGCHGPYWRAGSVPGPLGQAHAATVAQVLFLTISDSACAYAAALLIVLSACWAKRLQQQQLQVGS